MVLFSFWRHILDFMQAVFSRFSNVVFSVFWWEIKKTRSKISKNFALRKYLHGQSLETLLFLFVFDVNLFFNKKKKRAEFRSEVLGIFVLSRKNFLTSSGEKRLTLLPLLYIDPKRQKS